MNQAFSKIWIVVIVVILLSSVGGFFVWQWWNWKLAPNKNCQQANDCVATCGCGCINKNSKCELPLGLRISCEGFECECINNKCVKKQIEISKDETADWQTYRNEEYGFEVKYPNAWGFVKDSDTKIHFDVEKNDEAKIYYTSEADNIYIEVYPSLDSLPYYKKEGNFQIWLAHITGHEEEPYQSWIEQKDYFGPFRYIKRLFVGSENYEGIVLEENVHISRIENVFLIHNSVFYRISVDVDKTGEFDQMLSTFRFVETDSQRVATNFCEEKEGFVKYSSLLNFDQDGDNEILVICGDSSEWSVGSEIWSKNFYILDKQNQDYKLIWQRNTSKDFYSNLYTIRRPEINDVNKDGIDEIFFTGSIWGGTCTGASDLFFLYSPKYNELFYIEVRDEFDPTCTTILTSIKTSTNLGLEKYKIFKEFLEQKSKRE